MHFFFTQFFIFVYKQASAALFGGILLLGLVVTKYISIPGIHRYDLLFFLAVLTQVVLIITKQETKREVLVILIFHVCAMLMELYKTSSFVGSWAYPEPAFFSIGPVPLFTGFMYSSVGSYIARSWRVSKFRFEKLPSRPILLLFGFLIYMNFFTNAFFFDFRYILFSGLVVIFWNTKFYFELTDREFQLHPLLTNVLLAFFVWVAEQIGTFARAWVYPNQTLGWRPVSLHMFTSWYMLLIFSFIIISSLYVTQRND